MPYRVDDVDADRAAMEALAAVYLSRGVQCAPLLAAYAFRHSLLASRANWTRWRSAFFRHRRASALTSRRSWLEVARAADADTGLARSAVDTAVGHSVSDEDATVLYHFLQRWTRQVGAADSPVQVSRSHGGGHVGLAWMRPLHLASGEVLWPDVLDGLAWVPPALDVAFDFSALMSRCFVPLRGGGHVAALLFGPLQLINEGGPGCPLELLCSEAGDPDVLAHQQRRIAARHGCDNALLTAEVRSVCERWGCVWVRASAPVDFSSVARPGPLCCRYYH
jgi:hypothetical protein